MSYPINYPTPQGANVQIFTANTNTTADKFSATWVKPQGASMVWFTLIGAGGRGGTATTDASGSTAAGGGGGSGAVTNCMMPAFLIPDTLVVRVYPGIASPPATEISYQNKSTAGFSLLTADSGNNGGNASTTTVAINGSGGAGGVASNSNSFSAAGFFQSIEGQGGRAGNQDQIAATTTFLQGGSGGSANSIASQYGYSRPALSTPNQPGYAMISPILVSLSATYGTLGSINSSAKSGFGSGGGGGYTTSVDDTAYGSLGGDGLVVIVTW